MEMSDDLYVAVYERISTLFILQDFYLNLSVFTTLRTLPLNEIF
jgi:hypothetical protein